MGFVISSLRCSSHPTSSTGRPENSRFRGVFLCKKFSFSEGGKLATHTQTHTGEKTQRTGGEARLPGWCAVCSPLRSLSHLRHEIAHGLGCLVLLLPRGVGVGAEGESCIVVSQHGGDGFDIHSVLEGQGGEGVPEIVEPEVFQPRVFQNALVKGGHRVRVVHGAGAGGGEEPGIAWMLCVLLDKQFHRLLGDGDQPDRVLCFRPCYDQVVVLVLSGLLVDGDSPLFRVQVLPPQGHQLALVDTADQLQIEHGEGIPRSTASR